MPSRGVPRKLRRDSKLKTGVVLSVAFGNLACSSAAPTPQEASSSTIIVVGRDTQPPSANQDVDDSPSITDKLRPYVVLHTSPARRTLFTWTTSDQIEALGRDRVLLTRTESPTQGASYFDQIVAQRAFTGDWLAKLLQTDAFRRARFAWASPWPTLLGWAGESYGQELIVVTLKPSAWIAKLMTSKSGSEIVDLDNRAVPTQDAMQHPERIAAVYFVHDIPGRGSYGTYGGTMAGRFSRPGYREYVLCNESMIDTWSMGTEQVAKEIANSAEALDMFRRFLLAHPANEMSVPAWNKHIIQSIWPGPDLRESPLSLYEASLSFPNENYLPKPEQIANVTKQLRAIVHNGPAVRHSNQPIEIRK